MKSSYKDSNPFVSVTFRKLNYQISDLSQHLRIYLNLREATVQSIILKGEQSNYNNSIIIETQKRDLYKCYSYCTNYLDTLSTRKEDLKLKLLALEQHLKLYPNSLKSKSFKLFLKNKIKLWYSITILSKLAIQLSPLLLNKLLNILINLYDSEIKLNEDLSDFFRQLTLNHQKLRLEYKTLLSKKEFEYLKNERNKEFQKSEVKVINDIKGKSSDKKRIRSR